MEERFFSFSSFTNYSSVIYGISTRNFGNMSFFRGEHSQVIKNRQNFLQGLGLDLKNVVTPAIVHGSTVTIVDQADRGKGAEDFQGAILGTDGLATSEANVALLVTIADCFPIFIFDPSQGNISLAHAGWRGIIGGIVDHQIEAMTKLGSQRENLMVGIGPGICQKHFVVRGDTLKRFLDHYPSASFVRNKDGYVDLRKAIRIDLLKNNILTHNIEISSLCPACSNQVLGSHRLEGEEGPASAALICLRE